MLFSRCSVKPARMCAVILSLGCSLPPPAPRQLVPSVITYWMSLQNADLGSVKACLLPPPLPP